MKDEMVIFKIRVHKESFAGAGSKSQSNPCNRAWPVLPNPEGTRGCRDEMNDTEFPESSFENLASPVHLPTIVIILFFNSRF